MDKIKQLNRPSWCEGTKDKKGKPSGMRIFSERISFQLSNTIEKREQIRDVNIKTGERAKELKDVWIPSWVCDIETISEESLEKQGVFSKRIKIKFIVKPNDLTYIIRDNRITDFNASYRFKGKDITQTGLDELKNDLISIPITSAKGTLDDTKTRPISPHNWIDIGQSNQITLTATTVKEIKTSSHYHQISQIKLGSSSITFTYRGSSVTYGEVTNSTTSEKWLDRNLGASKIPTSKTDFDGTGDYMQWGRLDDGHQAYNSGLTWTLSTTDDPGHDDFISVYVAPFDWRSGQNDDLWNPDDYDNLIASAKVLGYRLPTESEWEAEFATWDTADDDGAFGSDLILTLAGTRDYRGTLVYLTTNGLYWSSTTSGTNSMYLTFNSAGVDTYAFYRVYGMSIRLIYDADLIPSTGTNTQINISDAWKAITAMKINIGDSWKAITAMKINIGDSWKDIF